jgi:hypothetical protein
VSTGPNYAYSGTVGRSGWAAALRRRRPGPDHGTMAFVVDPVDQDRAVALKMVGQEDVRGPSAQLDRRREIWSRWF